MLRLGLWRLWWSWRWRWCGGGRWRYSCRWGSGHWRWRWRWRFFAGKDPSLLPMSDRSIGVGEGNIPPDACWGEGLASGALEVGVCANRSRPRGGTPVRKNLIGKGSVAALFRAASGNICPRWGRCRSLCWWGFHRRGSGDGRRL